MLRTCGMWSPHTHTFIHNESVQSWNSKILNWWKYWTLSFALWFVTTHWFWKLDLHVSWSTKIRIWYFLFWQYEAENLSLSVEWSRVSFQNADFYQTPIRWKKFSNYFSLISNTPSLQTFRHNIKCCMQQKQCNCFKKIKCCYIVVKVIALFKFIKWCHKLYLFFFFFLFINTDESSHEIFNIRGFLTVEGKCLCFWKVVLKFMH
jgi:hypothetical protein